MSEDRGRVCQEMIAMPESDSTAVAEPETKARPRSASPKPRRQPPYNVILIDDDDHSYEYVIEMLGRLFGHDPLKAFTMAAEVDTAGRVIVDTTTKERAELKRDQIHAYGKDWRLPRCKGAMRAAIEPAPDPG
jgi:ATP-dependent Clp protease adaptor protein ClpS